MEKSTATGCYKCGRPGHWSRDCPFASSKSNQNNTQAPSSTGKSWTKATTTEKPAQAAKVKRAPRQRPKLTPELLLSDDGLGYVLEHIPRMMNVRGRGHEVGDLGRLIEAYIHWHSRLLPYFSFSQFVERVEKVGCTKPVRVCLRELRERVAKGENPKTLHEPPVEAMPADDDMVDEDVGLPSGLEDQNRDGAGDIHEDMFDELFRQATGEDPASLQKEAENEGPSHSSQEASTLTTSERPGGQQSGHDIREPRSKIQISEDQKARMEANRLKALERSAARAAQAQAL